MYENALLIELNKRGLSCSNQIPIDVYYDGEKVGFYFTDFIVEDLVIVKMKAAEKLCEEHEARLVNYLKATTIEVGLLLNFGKKPEFKRKVFSSQYKNLNQTSQP